MLRALLDPEKFPQLIMADENEEFFLSYQVIVVPFYTFSSIYLRRTVLWHSVKCDDIDIDRDIDLQMTLGHNHL